MRIKKITKIKSLYYIVKITKASKVTISIFVILKSAILFI